MRRVHRASGILLLQVVVVPAATVGQVIPDDPDFSLQWGLHNTGQGVNGQAGDLGADVAAPDAWAIHRGTSSVVVAIVGTGIDPHPEFAGRLLEGVATVGDLYSTLDERGSGSSAAGIIGASTGTGAGMAGLNPNVWLLPVRVTEEPPDSAGPLAAGIEWSVDQGADIVVVLLYLPEGTQALADAVAYAGANDAVIIAPAGNTGSNEVAYPAAYDGCLAVSATTNLDERATFSSHGAAIDLSAPGKDIWSTWLDGGFGYHSSTSAAAAFVAGVAALVRSYAPQLSALEVHQILLDSADDLGPAGPDSEYGAGRLNARAALDLAPPPALRFEHVGPLPDTVQPETVTSLAIRIEGAGETLAADSAELFYRIFSAEFSRLPLVALGNGLFRAELPPAPCETTIEFYFRAEGWQGTGVLDPLGAPGEVHRARAVIEETVFDDDFEEDRGWEVHAEGGHETEGAWIRVVPVGTAKEPAFDFTPDSGRYCYVTGAAEDVDGGPVRLVSPVIPFVEPDAEISYARWFRSTAAGEPDTLTVEFSRDGGDSWTLAEAVTSSAASWQEHAFRLSDFPGVSGDRLRVRFSVADPSEEDSWTEAAIDEFRVRAVLCSFAGGDFNGDGYVDLDDLAGLPSCMRGPATSYAEDSCRTLDFGGDGDVDLGDCQEFQNFFRPRPQ